MQESLGGDKSDQSLTFEKSFTLGTSRRAVKLVRTFLFSTANKVAGCLTRQPTTMKTRKNIPPFKNWQKVAPQVSDLILCIKHTKLSIYLCSITLCVIVQALI